VTDVADLQRLVDHRMASRLAGRDTSVFLSREAPADAHEAIQQRLGWLDAPATMEAHVPDVVAFADQVRADGLTDVYLLGMGGSSLCADVLRTVRPGPDGRIRLVVLDTTDEWTIRDATDGLTPAHALFLVASKSGATIEVTSLERHFWSVMTLGRGDEAGRHFAAITDPDTALVRLATARAYRHTFLNPADIGGRYSALSLFGLVPGALLGHDLAALLASARSMAERCRADDASNPGLLLGAFMATEAAAGRDKLTLLLPAPLAALGAWIEQLVAESTGKDGRGVLPVVGEPRGRLSDYRRDRAFVAVRARDAAFDRAMVRRLELASHPVFHIDTAVDALGAEFFRWEFATAVAGAMLAVNPFDEPNVREAKTRTKRLLDQRRRTGAFRLDPPFERMPGYMKRVNRPATDEPGLPDRYLAILDFLPGEPWRIAAIDRLRGALRRRGGMATTYGVGPRYLHSTGQYHKGGPNTGRFVLLTAADATATPVPETDYSFSLLKQAQALGDFETLAAAGREVIHYHFEHAADVDAALEGLAKELR
jgi:glucose-6-phosphate isomerase